MNVQYITISDVMIAAKSLPLAVLGIAVQGRYIATQDKLLPLSSFNLLVLWHFTDSVFLLLTANKCWDDLQCSHILPFVCAKKL